MFAREPTSFLRLSMAPHSPPVQCHPSLPVIATSGIETVVRLWSPSDALPSPAAVRELTDELDGVVGRNQERMKEGPSMLR